MNDPIVEIRLYMCQPEPRRVLVDAPRHAGQAGRVLDQEGHLEADEHEPERDDLPSLSLSIRPGHLREPVVQRRQHAEGGAAERRRSGSGRRRSTCPSAASRPGRRRGRCPVMPPSRNVPIPPTANSSGTRYSIVPAPQRRDPVEDLHAGRHRDDEAREHEEGEHDGRRRHGEHVVRPHEQAEEGDARRGGGDRLVAEDRLAREDRQHLGEDAERGQDEDVDLGVAEEPEQVLPQQRRAALVRVEEGRRRSCGRAAASSPSRPATDSAMTIRYE